jgi:hypothetical protein
MEEKIKNNLIRMLCPQEFDIEIVCNLKCPVSQMEKCWSEAFENYKLEISENENKFKYKMYGHSFKFVRKG